METQEEYERRGRGLAGVTGQGEEKTGSEKIQENVVGMETVKKKLESLIAYMWETERNNSPWNYANITSYDDALKKVWSEYVEEIAEMCSGLDAKPVEIGERLARISRSKLFEVE